MTTKLILFFNDYCCLSFGDNYNKGVDPFLYRFGGEISPYFR